MWATDPRGTPVHEPHEELHENDLENTIDRAGDDNCGLGCSGNGACMGSSVRR